MRAFDNEGLSAPVGWRRRRWGRVQSRDGRQFEPLGRGGRRRGGI